jgi:hypothetical protein
VYFLQMTAHTEPWPFPEDFSFIFLNFFNIWKEYLDGNWGQPAARPLLTYNNTMQTESDTHPCFECGFQTHNPSVQGAKTHALECDVNVISALQCPGNI